MPSPSIPIYRARLAGIAFFNRVIGLPASWVGAAIMVALTFDAIFDPLLGQWSDHLQSSWGRRHPFMYASVVTLAPGVLSDFAPTGSDFRAGVSRVQHARLDCARS
jgi:MFS/sugar transport protein